MARCALVSFSGYPLTPSALMPDNGLAALAGSLIQAGHECLILDLNTVSTMARLYPARAGDAVRPMARAILAGENRPSWRDQLALLRLARRLQRHQAAEVDALARDLVNRLITWRPSLVAFKLWTGDGYSGAVRMAKAVRAGLPEVPIAAGGPHVDYFGGHIHHHTGAFDVLVRGDGERAIVDLCEWAEGRRSEADVAGAIWHTGKAIRSADLQPVEDLGATAFPSYAPAVYPALWGNEKIKIAVVEESRGCPHRCSFCIHPIKSGGRWRVKPVARVLDEIERLRLVLGSKAFVYAGSNTPGKAAAAYARAILSRGLDVQYACAGHPKRMAGADFALLRQSGCEAICYGIESGSPRLLRDAFGRTTSPDDMRRAVLPAKAAGVFTVGSIIFPAPFETADSRRATLHLLRSIRPDSVPVTTPLMLPGTPWHRAPWRYGFEVSRRRNLYAHGLTYKVRPLFPPAFWPPLPYKLNGKPSRVFMAETSDFITDVEAAGLLTGVGHELALMARILGTPARLFRDEARTAFFTGDTAWVARLADRINDVARPHETSVQRGVGLVTAAEAEAMAS